jgi:hypothetical protein
MKNLFVIMLFLLSFKVLANERGNGGDAVVCRGSDGVILSAELLDYYEGRTLRNFQVVPEMGENNESLLKEVGAKLASFEENPYMDFTDEALRLDEALQEYLKSGRRMRDDIIFTHDPLRDIPDSGELILRRGCQVEQVAIRIKQRFPEDPAYIFQAEILTHLSPLDVRGLILHEMFYMYLITRQYGYGQEVTDSIVVRYLHQKIMSQQVAQFQFWDYLQIINKLYAHEDIQPPYLMRKGRFKLDISSASKESDGRIMIWDREVSMEVVLDSNGNLNRDKTLKYGCLRMDSLTNPFVLGLMLGHIKIETRGEARVYPLASNISLAVFFGPLNLDFDLQAVQGWDGKPMDIGVRFREGLFAWKEIKEPIILSSNQGMKFQKNLILDLDEELNLIVREL